MEGSRMQPVYYQTSNFIRHTGNVVDLNEYRRKMALAQEGSLAPQPEIQDFEDNWEQPVLREVTPRPRRSHQREKRAMVLDLCASLSVVVMTLTFTVQMLVL